MRLCSFCGRGEEEVRLFRGQGAGDDGTPLICAVCIRSFRTEVPSAKDPLAEIESRLRQGLHDPSFLRGLLDTFIEYAQNAEAQHAPDNAAALVDVAERWKRLLRRKPVDLDQAEALGMTLEAERTDHEAWRLLAKHYATWLRGRKMDRPT